VREFADNVLKYGRDTYGPKHTPLFVDGLNVNTHEPVKWIAPNGDRWILSNLASQQTLFRTLDGLTRITGDQKYKQAAMDAIKYAFENLRSPNGLLYWGGHAAYDAETNRPCGRGTHELKGTYPYYELMWEVDPQATKQFIEAFWSGHIRDWSRLILDRHCYNMTQPLNKPWEYEYKGGSAFSDGGGGSTGYDMIHAGSDMFYAAALLTKLSVDKTPLCWGKRLAQRYIDARNPKTGISPIGFRGDLTPYTYVFPRPEFSNQTIWAVNQYYYMSTPGVIVSPITRIWLCQLLLSEELGYEGEAFRRWAHEELTAIGKISYNKQRNVYVPISEDGTSIEGYFCVDDGPLGPKGSRLIAFPARPYDFLAYTVAYRITNDKFMWDIARNIAIGNNYGDIGASPMEGPQLNYLSTMTDPYGLMGFLQLYQATGSHAMVTMAERIADNILIERLHNGLFVGASQLVFCKFDTIDSLALLYLYLASCGRKEIQLPQVYPGISFFDMPYRYKDEVIDNFIYTHTDSFLPLSIQEAAATNNIDLVKSLIEEGNDVDSWEDTYKNTALHRAAISGHKEIAELLINAGARIDAKAGSDTPLHYAVEYGHKDIAELLIANGADLNAARDYPAGDTPLHTAVRVGNKDIIELLVAKGADLNVKNNDGQTPLDIVVNKGYVDTAKLLISKGADINVTDNRGSSLLHLAAQNGQQDIAELLIDKGADINIKNKSGETPLDIAVREGHRGIVELLVAKGAKVSSIFVAAAIGDLAKVKAFLEEGADVNTKGPRGQTALHIAASEGHKQIVELLIENGADINAGDNLNRTAAEFAMDNNHSHIVELLISRDADVSPLHLAISMKDETKALSLIENGADVNKKTRYGTTPLHTAVQAGMKNIVELLIKKGADINAKNNWGWTPINFSIYSGKEDIFELIVAAGADVNTKSGSDKTPLQYAKQRGLTEIVEILRKHGAIEEQEKAPENTPAPKEDKETDPNAVELKNLDAEDLSSKETQQIIPPSQMTTSLIHLFSPHPFVLRSELIHQYRSIVFPTFIPSCNSPKAVIQIQPKYDYRFIPFCALNTAIRCEETRKNANSCENPKTC